MFSILQTDMKNEMKFKIILIAVMLIVIVLIGIVSPITEKITGTEINYNERVEIDGRKFTFLSGGSLTVNYNNRNYEFSELSKVDFTENGVNIVKEPQIIFDDSGKIKEAYFITGKDGEYILGNEILNLQKGTKVIFKDGTALIQVPGEVFQAPRTADNKVGETSFTFYSDGDKGVKFGEHLIKGGLGYEQGNYFIQKQDKIELADIIISNPNHLKTYIDFEGKVNFAYKGSYISMDRNNGILVAGSNVNNPSPAIMVKKENAYGLKFDSDNDHFAFQSSGSVDGTYFKIKRSKPGIVPEMEHLNGFELNENDKSFYYDGEKEKLYYTKGKLIKDFGEAGSSMVAATLTGSFKTKNGRIESAIGDSVLGISNFNEYSFGKDKRFIRLKHYNKNPGFFTGISDLESYNYELTEQGFERITGIQLVADDSSGRSYLNDPKNMRYLYDLLFSIPLEQTKMVNRMHFASGGGNAEAGINGRTTSVYFTLGRATSSGNRLSASTWRHEMGHVVDFRGGRNRRFDRMWYDSGINNIAITSNYASDSGAERISEFIGNFAYHNQDEYERSINHLLNSNKDKDWWRAAVAVAWYNYGFTYERTGEIFSQAGLPYDVNSLYGYMRKVGIRVD